MNSLHKYTTSACALILAFTISACANTSINTAKAPQPVAIGYGADSFTIGELIYETDFSDKDNWVIQIQEDPGAPQKGKVKMDGGMLDAYMPATGCTAWLNKKLSGPITIVYQVKCPLETINGDSIQARDVNNFWHCSDPKEFDALLTTTEDQYHGGFVSYHEMQGYYASTGGGGHVGNQTTRFRRYPRWENGKDIPHISLNDKDSNPDYLLTPGKWHTVQLVADDGMVQYIMDGKVFYEIKYGDTIVSESRVDGETVTTERTYSREDYPAYDEGYFGLRLVRTHHQYRNLKIYQLEPKQEASSKWENTLYKNIAPAPVGGGIEQEDYWVWGSSVAKADDAKYHMFVSRWPKELPFHPGWMVASEIAHCVSDSPEGPYEFVDVALGARGAKYWDGRSVHNPRVVKYKDTYVMYYMGSTHPFEEITDPSVLTLDSHYTVVARSNKRIGIATSKDLNGPWERRDACILPTQPDTFYEFLTSNPAPWINEDGSVKLIFKSRKYNESFPYHSSMKIGLATAEHFEGPYTVVGDEPIFGADKMGEVEDPYLWRDEAGYHMIAKDMHDTLAGQHHSGILAHSKDALNWTLDKEPLAYSRTLAWDNGQTIQMGQLERPFGLIENGKITHLFFATMDGPGGFGNSTKSWNMVVPLTTENTAD